MTLIFSAVSIAFFSGGTASSAHLRLLTTDEYILHQPNELGRVPVFMYHNIVPNDSPRDPNVDEYMYRTYDQFWGDMLWLYENGFHLIGMNDLVSGNIDIPLGKHPVVFTFDDSSSLHFSYIEDEAGELVIADYIAIEVCLLTQGGHTLVGTGHTLVT